MRCSCWRSDSMKSLQELADEAFADLLKKHGRPVTLKQALRESVRRQPANDAAPRRKKRSMPPTPTLFSGTYADGRLARA